MSSFTRKIILFVFAILTALSVFFAFQIQFTFDFEQFFPENDPDLEYFLEFRKNFEDDDNFLMIALEGENGVFNAAFLDQMHDFTLQARDIPSVNKTLSITTLSFPIKLPFGGYSSIPVVRRDQPNKLAADSIRVMKDERLVNSLISKDGKAAVVLLKVIDAIPQDKAEKLMADVTMLLGKYDFKDNHILGRAFFQKEMVAMQKREVTVSTLISGFLVSLVMFLIYRKTRGILIALVSIGLGMILFLGLLGGTGREMNAMSALYPVLMVIVGTSDVIHIMTKYLDELRKGKSKKESIQITIREIGLATLFTSVTTAIGFATLLTSRIGPIKDFGLNAAAGVMVAYLTVIFFTTALLSMYPANMLVREGRGVDFWNKWMTWAYEFSKQKRKQIIVGGVLAAALCALGISKVTTNFRLENNMPIGAKITNDFNFFEQQFSGFRPFEVAVTVLPDSVTVDDFIVAQELDKLEQYLGKYPEIESISSVTAIYKSLNRASMGDKPAYYKMPTSEAKYKQYQRMAKRFAQSADVLVSKDRKKARVAARIQDIGADNIAVISSEIDGWIAQNMDTTLLQLRQTGTGVIVDKNAKYIRNSLLSGLAIAIFIISLLMALLFRSLKMVIISMIPNVFPLILAGALLGFLGIQLDAGIAVVFAVVFGIAVDDTIHFLSKYKIARTKGADIEEALLSTFLETGKAICLTSIILFFGFLVMLFSIHPPSIHVGLLISLTLASAVLADMLFIPVLIRTFFGEQEDEKL